jgi:hypothetical protein
MIEDASRTKGLLLFTNTRRLLLGLESGLTSFSSFYRAIATLRGLRHHHSFQLWHLPYVRLCVGLPWLVVMVVLLANDFG